MNDRKKREAWFCEVCGEHKTAMHGNPDSGWCADCWDETSDDGEFTTRERE